MNLFKYPGRINKGYRLAVNKSSQKRQIMETIKKSQNSLDNFLQYPYYISAFLMMCYFLFQHCMRVSFLDWKEFDL